MKISKFCLVIFLSVTTFNSSQAFDLAEFLRKVIGDVGYGRHAGKTEEAVKSEEIQSQKNGGNIKKQGDQVAKIAENRQGNTAYNLPPQMSTRLSELLKLVFNPDEKTPQKIQMPVNSTCNQGTEADKLNCRQGLFQGCAEQMYASIPTSADCQSFQSSDYDNYLDSKRAAIASHSQSAQEIETSMGQITPSLYQYNPANTIQNDTINPAPYVPTEAEVKANNEAESPYKGRPQTLNDTNTNAQVQSGKDKWITGWGTLFCIGEKCNSVTALGFNPYGPCIVALPYKTIDYYFETRTNNCVYGDKEGKTIGQCLKPYYEKVKGRAIEVEIIKNGKRGVFPLGDVGPNEWTGNAIDFTAACKPFLGVTGKDQTRFRPAPSNKN